MMDNKLLEATYLVDETYLLHLQETDAGMEYQCFDKNGAEVGVGLISWGDMLDSDIRSPLACAHVLAIQDIGLDGEKVAAVSRDMLSQFPRGRKLLYQMEKDGMEADSRSIRFIDSHYNEKFRIPDGGVIQTTYLIIIYENLVSLCALVACSKICLLHSNLDISREKANHLNAYNLSFI